MGVREAGSAAARVPNPSPRGGPRLRECAVEIEVPFHDVDAMRVVWHGHYFKYLEQARTALLRSCALDVSDLVSLRLAFVVIDSGCRYIAPLRYGDRMRVSAWFRDISHRLYVGYEIQNLCSGDRAARAHTVLATISFEGKVFYRTPDAILERVDPQRKFARQGEA